MLIAGKIMRKKSAMDMSALHLCVLAFVNSFGYMLPTLYMIKRGDIGVFEYLFRSFYVDLVFTAVLSLTLLKRSDLKTTKLLLPIALCIFGFAFHETAYVTAEGTLSVLTFKFSETTGL
jgi:hypothetical protein